MIRVQIAASSAAVRAGLESLVGSSPGLTATDSYADVVLAAVALDELAPAPAIVLLGEGAWSGDALHQGVRAVLPSDASAAEILAAIEAAAAGLAVIDPRDLEALLSAAAPPPVAESAAPLTARELEVLRSVAEGIANKEVAARLSISQETVKAHMGSILSKLSANDRTHAVLIGMKRGIIDP